MTLKELLPRRMYEVTTFVAGDYSNKDIAILMNTTENVIKNYLHSVYILLGYAEENGVRPTSSRLRLANRYAEERKSRNS